MSRETYLEQIIDYISENEIYEFADIVDYCCDNDMDWFECLCDNPYVIVEYIASKRRQKNK